MRAGCANYRGAYCRLDRSETYVFNTRIDASRI